MSIQGLNYLSDTYTKLLPHVSGFLCNDTILAHSEYVNEEINHYSALGITALTT